MFQWFPSYREILYILKEWKHAKDNFLSDFIFLSRLQEKPAFNYMILNLCLTYFLVCSFVKISFLRLQWYIKEMLKFLFKFTLRKKITKNNIKTTLIYIYIFYNILFIYNDVTIFFLVFPFFNLEKFMNWHSMYQE